LRKAHGHRQRGIRTPAGVGLTCPFAATNVPGMSRMELKTIVDRLHPAPTNGNLLAYLALQKIRLSAQTRRCGSGHRRRAQRAATRHASRGLVRRGPHGLREHAPSLRNRRAPDGLRGAPQNAPATPAGRGAFSSTVLVDRPALSAISKRPADERQNPPSSRIVGGLDLFPIGSIMRRAKCA